MSDDVDPLAEQEDPLPRDRYGRPLITPAKRDGTPNTKGKPVPYTRASTFCGYPADKSGLTKWQIRCAVLGVAKRPDLAGMIGALGSNVNDLTPAAKRDLDQIIETAHDAGGGNDKANYGTAMHSLTEPDNTGFVPDRMAADVAAYQAAMTQAGLEVVDTERFTVNDDVNVAGTYDHKVRTTRVIEFEYIDNVLVRIPAGTLLKLDKKTGQALHFDEHAIQLATYARGKLYDPVTGEREANDVSPQWGVVAHIPAGKGTCILYMVDLSAGWRGAKIAAQVRDWRSGGRKLGVKLLTVNSAEPSQSDTESHTDTETSQSSEVVAPISAGITAKILAGVSPGTTTEPATSPNGDVAAKPGNSEQPAGNSDMDEAVETITETFDATDAVLDQINAADTAGACRALWSKHRNAWTDSHTAAVKARLAELDTAA